MAADDIKPVKRRMTLPTSPGQVDPIHVQAQKPCEDPAHGAAFILIHGLGDTAEGLEGKTTHLISCLLISARASGSE